MAGGWVYYQLCFYCKNIVETIISLQAIVAGSDHSLHLLPYTTTYTVGLSTSATLRAFIQIKPDGVQVVDALAGLFLAKINSTC
jgi:hypothetical protein